MRVILNLMLRLMIGRWMIMTIATIIGIALTHGKSLDFADDLNTDLYHIILGQRHHPKATLIAALDSESMDLFPYTPLAFWGPNFAKIIEQLRQAGAVSVALDFQYLITPEQWLSSLPDSEGLSSTLISYDQSFDQALSRGRVILGARPIRNKYFTTVTDPPLEYLESLPNHRNDIGLTVLLRDSNAVVREFVPAQTSLTINNNGNSALSQVYETPNPWWTLAALAVKTGAGDHYLNAFKGESLSASHLIAYCGPPGTVPRISLSAFFREKGLSIEEKQLVSGRIVFIGGDEDHFGDRQRTPYSRQFLGLGHRDMSGLEIHSNIAETIMNPERIAVIPLWLTILFIWLPAMIVGIYASEKGEVLKKLGIIDLALYSFTWILGLIFFWKGYLFHKAGLLTAMSFYFVLVNVKSIFREKIKHLYISND